jgi:uncharacterized membrane protein YqiK
MWILIGIGVFIGLIVFIGLVYSRLYRKVNQGQALIVNKPSKVDVTFQGMLVIPVIHRSEVMDISLKTVELERRGSDGLICMDNLRADIKVTFFVKVNKTLEDVLQVAQAIGCIRASDQRTLEELFMAKFSEALKTVGKRFEFTQLYEERDKFKDAIIKVIGKDLSGYVLEDAAIDYLEQTPLSQMDPNNILDAEGIKKITEITAREAVLTNILAQDKRKQITAKNVEADEAVFELDKQRADAEAKQKREIANIRAREEAQVLTVQAEERQKAEQARLTADQAIAVQDENRQREVEVAKKNRERVVAVEHERVEKERQLEAIKREREVDLARISKEKEVEIEKKLIADVVAERVAVDKNVATEEEKIKDLRAIAAATRNKDVIVITAEAEAQDRLVKEIKVAEAAEKVAQHKAREKLVTADADLQASDKLAAAKIRLSEGVQAEVAAAGLAQAKVKEADAVASEKMGLAQARVVQNKMEAEAEGSEKQGMAAVRVQEAEASAIEKTGLAEATVTREKMLAQATGDREQGLAQVHIKEAEAVAIEKKGLAEATATREKLVAEAAGLAEKATAMKALDGVGREHEEFRLELDKAKQVELAELDVRREIATAQAHILREAFATANIQIVGGDGQFFDKFINALTLGKSLDGAVDSSDSIKKVFGDYLSGKASLPADLKEILTRPALTAEGAKDLSLAAVLARLASGRDEGVKGKLDELVQRAKDLGIDKLTS